jgi:hypothetical protein
MMASSIRAITAFIIGCGRKVSTLKISTDNTMKLTMAIETEP